jgi:hypothetical protein
LVPGSASHHDASNREKSITTATSRDAVNCQLRALLYEAAAVLLTRVGRESALRRWGLLLWKRIGFKRAATALARTALDREQSVDRNKRRIANDPSKFILIE